MSQYKFNYQGTDYNWDELVSANQVPPPLKKPLGLDPRKQKLTTAQRNALTPAQATDRLKRETEFATYEASERIRAQIQQARMRKPVPANESNEKPDSGLTARKSKKEVWGVYRADGTQHTQDELEIGRQALMALVKTTNDFSKNANKLLLQAQSVGNVDLEKKIKATVAHLNRKGGLDISRQYEDAPQKVSAKDLQTLVDLMEEADDVIDRVQEFQVSTEHLNTVIQKFDLGDKLQIAERKKFIQMLGLTEKGIGNSLAGLAKNSPKELTKSTGGASTILATMLGGALGPFGDLAAMMVNNDWVSEKIEGFGGKGIDFVKGKVSSQWGKFRGLGKKGAKLDTVTEGDAQTPSVPGSTESATTQTSAESKTDQDTTGTLLTSVTTSKGSQVKPMGEAAPYLDVAALEKFAQEISNEIEKGILRLYKILGGKAFDSEDLKLYLDTLKAELPKEFAKLTEAHPDQADLIKNIADSMHEALSGDSRDVLGRLDTLIESVKPGTGEAERELELNRAEKAEQRRHDELLDVLKTEGKLERKLLKKELDDVERKAGQGGGGILGTLAQGALMATVGGWLLKKMPWLRKVPGLERVLGGKVAAEGAEVAAKTVAKPGVMGFLGRQLARIPKKGKLGAAAAAAALLLGATSESSAAETTGQATPAIGGPTPGGQEPTAESTGNAVNPLTAVAAYGAAGLADGALQTAGRKAVAAGTSATGGLLGGTLLKAGAKRIPIIGGAVDGYMTYRSTGSLAQGIGAGLGNAVGGVAGAAGGTLVAPGVGTVAGEVAGSIGGSMAGQELGRQFEKDPQKFASLLMKYGTPMGLAFAGLTKLSKAVGITSDAVSSTAKNVDKTTTAVGDNSKSVETTTKDIEETTKATEGWMSRLSRMLPAFMQKALGVDQGGGGGGGGGEGGEKTDKPVEVVKGEVTPEAAALAKAKKYRDAETEWVKRADAETDPEKKAKYYDIAGTNAMAAKAQESAARAHRSVAAKSATTATGTQYGTGSPQDIVWNDGSGTETLRGALTDSVGAQAQVPVTGVKGVGKYNYSGGGIRGLSPEQSTALAQNTAATESAKNKDGSLNYSAMGGSSNRFAGKYQFGAEALASVGLIDLQKYKAAKKRGMGEKAIIHDESLWTVKGGLSAYLKDEAMQDRAFRDLANQNISTGFKMGTLNDASSAEDIAAFAKTSHLLGAGAARDVFRGKDSSDAFGTRGSKYANDARMAIRSVGKGTIAETSGTMAVAAAAPDTGKATNAQAWSAPMKYEAKAAGGSRLGLPDVLRPAQDQNPLGQGATAVNNTVGSRGQIQPSIADASFMPDDIGLMLVASGMV